MQSSQQSQQQERRHTFLTCYDDRIDNLVEQEIERLRAQGDIIRNKDIYRPRGGVHHYTRSDCRAAFYGLLTSCSDIAPSSVFHFWPHTNCQFCGLYHPEKIGSGAQSDLRFHVKSAEKMLKGTTDHFLNSSERMPELDIRIILTVDQRFVTIAEAHALLPEVPEHSHHGAPCLSHHGHPPEHRHPVAVHHGHGIAHGHEAHPLS